MCIDRLLILTNKNKIVARLSLSGVFGHTVTPLALYVRRISRGLRSIIRFNYVFLRWVLRHQVDEVYLWAPHINGSKIAYFGRRMTGLWSECVGARVLLICDMCH